MTMMYIHTKKIFSGCSDSFPGGSGAGEAQLGEQFAGCRPRVDLPALGFRNELPEGRRRLAFDVEPDPLRRQIGDLPGQAAAPPLAELPGGLEGGAVRLAGGPEL